MSKKNVLKERASEIEAWVELSKDGDQDAFAKIYDLFVDPIYRYIYYRVNHDDAEDLVEMVFLKVWEKIHQYKKKEKHYFSSWVFRIAHNLVVDHYRSAKDRKVEELDFTLKDEKKHNNPVLNTQNTLDQELLKDALGNLKDSYSEIIIYKFLQDLSNKEIADLLGKSEGSLRILQFRALKALRQELEDRGVSYNL